MTTLHERTMMPKVKVTAVGIFGFHLWWMIKCPCCQYTTVGFGWEHAMKIANGHVRYHQRQSQAHYGRIA